MPKPSSARLDTVLRATKRWQNDLVDTSGRNRLRRYRDLKTSTLDLTPEQAEGLNTRALNRLLADKPVTLGELFSEPPSDRDAPLPFDDARRRLNVIHRTALTNREEKGIETCFAGIGLATWKVEQGTEPNAPVILLPLEVEATGAAARDFKVEVSGDAHLNPVLTHILRDEHDIDAEGDEADVAEDPPMDLAGFHTLLAHLEESWSSLPDLTIERRVVVAIFSYSTMPLVSDLNENGELFAESDIVAAIAGDASAREALTSRICDPDPNQPDIDPPREEFLVLDADSSQHMAINRVLGGESLVIQGPPGTGKSQTIVNLITALIARGKRVLFVAEKRAAIEAVTKRLDQVGLSDLVMDMHGRITSRRDFARTLADSLDHVATIPAHDYSKLHGRLQERRDSLIANDLALHEPREPWKLCVFHMRERLLAIPDGARTKQRLSQKAAQALDLDSFERLSGEIEEWLDLGGHTLDEDHPEWARSTVATNDDARAGFDLVRDLAHEGLPSAQDATFGALDEVGLASPPTVAEWQLAIDFLSAVETTLERSHPDIYKADEAALHEVLTFPEGSLTAQMSTHFLEEGPDPEHESFDLSMQVGETLLPAARDSIFAALDQEGLNRPETVRGWQQVVEFLESVEETLKWSHPEVYRLDFTALRTALTLPEGSLRQIVVQLHEQGPDAEREGFDLITRLAEEVLPAARDALFAAVQEVGLSTPHTVSNWERVVALLSSIERTLERCSSGAYELDHAPLRKALAPAGKGGMARIAAQLLSRGYRSARQQILAVHKEPDSLSSTDLLRLAEELDEQAKEWRQQSVGDGHPRLPSNLQTTRELLEELGHCLDELGERCGGQEFYQYSQGELTEILAKLQAHWEARRKVSSTLRLPEHGIASSRSGDHENDVRPPAHLLELLGEASEQVNEWKRRGGRAGSPVPPSNLEEAGTLLGELVQVVDVLGDWGGVDDLRDRPYANVAATLAALKSHWEGREEVASTLRSAERLSASDALDLLDVTEAQKQEWKRRGGSETPRVPSGLGGARERVAELVRNLGTLADIVDVGDSQGVHPDEMSQTLKRLAAHPNVVASLPRIRELEQRFRKAGVSRLLDRVGETIAPELAVPAVEHAWLRRVLDDLEFDDRRLSTFDGEGHSRLRDEFADADRVHLESTPQRVHRLTAEAIVSTMNFHREETALVKTEAAKKRRHRSVRQLFAQAPHVLTALRPCWTMSPVLAAEMIPLNRQLFDVVIFDEASQIPPAEAIGSLARASQAVIAGDSRQLPPTSFFGRDSVSDEDEEDADAVALTGDIESLLDAAGVLLRDKMLQWHYRSRDDRLIAFSNSYIYGGSLTAFPGAIVDSPISHCLVPFRPITGVTGTRSNPDEVEMVVDLVLDHARETPTETLGVIAFGQHHAANIENALMRRLGELNDSSLDEFFSETNEERFFVKNIERVQGDERDVIILSVGYHKDANGNLPYRFGPILQEGGERRLNVAVTRARSRVSLVSSFSHRDMDPGRSSAKGAELLRQYLEYAASGGKELGAGVSDVPLNPFELSIKEGLERRGIPVTAQYGVSGYRIDFACAHPEEPGRMVLAVEADGASYHSSHTARDRDRLRQQVLEGKGWRFHRIWSTAWFRDREAELDKAEEAWKQAVAASDEEAPPPATAKPKNTSKAFHPPSPQRAPSPGVPPRGSPGYDSIDDYSLGQLVQLARWIESDTLLRTEDDLLREMMDELGFKRSGKRITEALQRAIRRARS